MERWSEAPCTYFLTTPPVFIIPQQMLPKNAYVVVLKLVALVFSPLRDCGLIVYNLINGHVSSKYVL